MPDGRRWKCFGCDRAGDAIDFIRERRNLSFKEAVEYLGGGLTDGLVPNPSVPSPKRRPAAPAPDVLVLRRHGEAIVRDCADRLHRPEGARAMQWLEARGIRAETIEAARLGFNQADHLISGIYLRRGITIPWISGGNVCGIKIRRPFANPKYIWVKGQHRSGLYLGDAIVPGRSTVIAEGELDALLCFQECGDLVGVATLGSASDTPDQQSLEQLLSAPSVFLCYDADDAARAGADRWSGLSQRTRTLRVPAGMDLTDIHRVTGNLRDWLTAHLHRHRLLTTLHPTLPTICMNDRGIGVGMDTLHLPYTLLRERQTC